MAYKMGDVLPKDVYKTLLQAHAATIVKDTQKREQLLFGNKIDISHHQPVILNLGRQIPKEEKHNLYDEFHAHDQHGAIGNISDALTATTGNAVPRNTLLIGPPGGGKTSLCMKILNMYSVNKWEGHDFIFYISLKTIRNLCPMAAVDFILGLHGPPVKHRNNMWEIIEKHEQRVLVVLDGLDEVNADFTEDMGYISDTDVPTDSTTIINSLIEGRLLPKCQLMMTTRPYKMDVLAFKVDRLLELAGLELASIEALIHIALEEDPDEAKYLTSYIRAHEEMEAFCRLPINIQILITIFKRNIAKGAGSSELQKLPKRKTALHMLSLEQFMEQSIRGAKQQTAAVSNVWDNEECVATFRKVVNLAGNAMRSDDGRKIMFEDNDLREVGLSDEEATRCGFLIATEQEVNQPGMRARIMYMFGHLLQLEMCASIHHVNRSVTDILELIGNGDGHMDAVCIFIVGLLGDPRCREILSSLYVGKTKGDWQRKLHGIMKELPSSRRIACTSGKFMLLEAYYESQGSDPHEMCNALRKGNRWDSLDLEGLRSYHLRSSLHFLRHLQGRFSDTEPGEDTDRPGEIVTALGTPPTAVKIDFWDKNAAEDCVRELFNMNSVKCVTVTNSLHGMPHTMTSLFGRLVLVDFVDVLSGSIETICDGLADPCCSVQGMRVPCNGPETAKLLATHNSSITVLVVKPVMSMEVMSQVPVEEMEQVSMEQVSVESVESMMRRARRARHMSSHKSRHMSSHKSSHKHMSRHMSSHKSSHKHMHMVMRMPMVHILKVGLPSLENLHLDPEFTLSENTEQILASHPRLQRVSEEECMSRMDIIYRATSKRQYLTTAGSKPLEGTGINEEGERSGATVTENTWCFEISNKTDYLESCSMLPYPIEVFVPARCLSIEEHSKLQVTVKQMIDHNDPPPSLPGNRQLGPIIRLEADQAEVQFVRPLLVFIRFPEEFLKDTDDYEYCVQYNSGKDIHGGIWNDITGYREGQVSGIVIQSHQTAVLLLNHFSLFTIFRRCKLLNVELHAYHIQQQDTHHVLVTCLVYLKPLRGTAEYKEELDSIKGQYQTSEAMAVSKKDKVKEVVLVCHQDEPWHLEGLRTQIIQIQPVLENNFMKKHFYFQGQGQSFFSCSIEANIPGCTANPRVLMPLQEHDQALICPSAEHGNNATCDSGQSVQPVKNTKSLPESINSNFFHDLTPSELAELSERQKMYNCIRELLNKNRVKLTENIMVDVPLWNHLIQNGVLCERERDNIGAKYVGNDQATGIIDWVRHSPHSYEAFRKCLRDSNQGHVVDDYLPSIPQIPNEEP